MTHLPHHDQLFALAEQLNAGMVPTLSILQPWPYHIFHDGKDVENRKWRTNRRGWIAIHAGKSDRVDPYFILQKALPLGAVVGFARIIDCVDASTSRWWLGPHGFVLADAFPVPPLPYRGQQGFFPLDAEASASLASSVRQIIRDRP